MSLFINTNASAVQAQRNLATNQAALSGSVARLSSGLRITSAADDAAGLAISETLRSQITGVNQAIRNANDGVSMLQIADGAASTIGGLLSRMRELASESASGSIDATNRSYVDNEFTALRSEVDRIASVTTYGKQALLSGSPSISLQIGFQSSANDTLTLTLKNLDTTTLGINAVNVSTSANGQSAVANIDSAISAVVAARATFGQNTNRLSASVDALTALQTGFTAADSRVRDADVAYETSKFTRNQVLVQAGLAILAQANAMPSQALTLLR